ncbi:hypothetical protein V1511DRAFT_451676, partial [Dipodascopsis uninucleata]
KTNLGETLDMLIHLLPNIQHERPPESLLSPQVQLRFFPKTHPGLPTIKGKTKYLLAWRFAQWVMPIFVLGPVEGLAELATMDVGSSSNDQQRRTANENSRTSTKYEDSESGRIHFKVISMRVINEDLAMDFELSPSQGYDDTPITKLIVRWETVFSQPRRSSDYIDVNKNQSTVTGIFTFEFDRAGKILVHSIDDIQEV